MGGLSGAGLVQQSITAQHDYVQGDKVGGDKVLGDKYTVQPSLPRYFHLCVIDPESDEPVDQLEPGKQYQVVLWTDTSPNSNQSAIPAQTSLSLLLKVQDTKLARYITIPDPQISLTANQIPNFKHQFDLNTDAQLPYDQITLELNCKEAIPRKVAELTLELDGSFNLVDEAQSEKCLIEFIERPEKVALLYVESGTKEDRCITLKGWGHYKGHCFEVPIFEVPDEISLSDFVPGQKPGPVIGRIEHFFTHANEKLTKWFDHLFEKHGNELILIITDLTDFEIPWEMYPLSAKVEQKNQYLGSNCIVARWGSFKNRRDKSGVQIRVQNESFSGEAFAYIDPFKNSQFEQEKEQIGQLTDDILNNKTILYQRLQGLQNSQSTGLIYIGSHGTFVRHDPFQAGLGHEDNPEGRILIFDLNRLPPCGTKRPVFFVNACHSARWFQVKKEFLGLHEVILGYFAKAYVGVCGMVNMDFCPENKKCVWCM